MSSKTTFVSLLLDETGSMGPIKDDTVGGFNTYIETLKEKGGDILFSLVTFNSSDTERRYVAEPIAEVRPLQLADYQPKAMTPLIDAAVKIIHATDEAVARRDDEPNVVIVIQTDGAENVSVEYTAAQLARLVKDKEREGWEFVFLGAGMDAFQGARDAGIVVDRRQVMSYGRGRSHQLFSALADNVSSFSISGSTESLHFSDEQRDEAGDEYAHGDPDSGAPSSRNRSGTSKITRKWRRKPASDLPDSTTGDYTL